MVLAWVTCRPARGRDVDEPLGTQALRDAGVLVEVVDWDDPGLDWTRFDRVVLRSAWDYPERLPEFLAWVDRVAAVTEVVNSPEIVRWNVDKRYLLELADVDVPVTPTRVVAPGDVVELPTGEVVVKPAVGAGGRDAAAYAGSEHDAAIRHIEGLHATGRAALVQPLVTSVATVGEWPLIFFDGRYSHAASKRTSLPRAGVVGDLFLEETNSAHVATQRQIDVAQAGVDVVAARFGAPAYARVDLVRDGTGDYCVMELELVEPSLFLSYADPSALERFVAAMTR